MLIGLISDTHIAAPDEKLPPEIEAAFDGVDLILHAGDIWVPSVLDELESIAPVMAAWGDDDTEADLGGDGRMIKSRDLFFEGITLWLEHIRPPYGYIVPRENKLVSRHIGQENIDSPDVVVSGHTHRAEMKHYKGVLLVNPGSATWPEYVHRLGTVALLEIDSGKAKARIVQLWYSLDSDASVG